MSNFSKVSVTADARVELHDKLSLTGAEISINRLPAGGSVPFVHAHKQNEEIYGILEGKGKAVIDGENVQLTAGDWVRIAPAAKRQFFAAEEEGISYICIQVKENSLEGYTMDDAIAVNE
ncbi:MAG TPA: cupin domain-containing protein [Candidatus Pullilachnospira intestinigallinarum]|nr:cupin domain-containing protein [Candidatus Pullilachnospira intestinigallinarum]